MKASAEKSSVTASKTATRPASQPFFSKAGGGNFFAPAGRMAAPSVQMKMTVGKSGDKFEREAIQKKGNDAVPSVSPIVQSAIRSKTSSAQPLSADVRRGMESRFNNDFSKVRIHSNAEAAGLSNQLGVSGQISPVQSILQTGILSKRQPENSKNKGGAKQIIAARLSKGSGKEIFEQVPTSVRKTESSKAKKQAKQEKTSSGKKQTSAINGAGGAAVPDQSANSVPDVAGADPIQALAGISNLPPVQLQASLSSVSAAIGNTVNEKRAELTANPPKVERSSYSTISKKNGQAVSLKNGNLPKKINRVSSKATQPFAAPKPINLPPVPSVSTEFPAVNGDSEGKISAGDIQVLQASVRQMPEDDSGLYNSKAEVPPLELNGDADPQQAQHQQAELEKSLADAQTEGQQDIVQPMGEDIELLGLNKEVTAKIGGGATGTVLGGASKGRKEEEGISILAQQEHGQKIQAAVSQAKEQITARKQEHVLKVAEEKEKSNQEISVLQTENSRRQEQERTKAQVDVGKQRAEWTEEQNTLLDTSRKEGNAAVAEGMQKVENEQTQAESKAAEHIAKGNQDAEQARLKGEQEAAAEKQKAEEKSDGIFGWLADKAKAFFDGIKQAIKKAFEIARAVVKAAIDAAKKLAAAVIEAARKAIVAAIKAVGDALIAIGDKLLAAFPEMRDRFRNAIKSVVQKAESAVNALAEQLQKGVQALLNLLGKGLDAALGLLEKGMLAAVDAVNNAVQGAIAAAKAVADAIGAFIALAKDIASGPGQWISNLGAAVVDGIRNHLWQAFKTAVKEWFNSKLEQVLGLGAMVWDLVKSGGLSLAKIGNMAWEGLKAMIPVALITILVEKLVSMIVPAAGAVKLILEGLQAAWGAASRIIAAFGAFFNFLKAVKGGGAGPQFAAALTAAAIAVIDFVANWLLAKLAKGAAKVGGKIKGLAKKLLGRRKGRKLGGKGKGQAKGKRKDAATGESKKKTKETASDKKRERLEKAVKAIQPQLVRPLAKGITGLWLKSKLAFWRVRYRLSALKRETDGSIIAKVNPGRPVITTIIGKGAPLMYALRQAVSEVRRDPEVKRKTIEVQQQLALKKKGELIELPEKGGVLALSGTTGNLKSWGWQLGGSQHSQASSIQVFSGSPSHTYVRGPGKYSDYLNELTKRGLEDRDVKTSLSLLLTGQQLPNKLEPHRKFLVSMTLLMGGIEGRRNLATPGIIAAALDSPTPHETNFVQSSPNAPVGAIGANREVNAALEVPGVTAPKTPAKLDTVREVIDNELKIIRIYVKVKMEAASLLFDSQDAVNRFVKKELTDALIHSIRIKFGVQ